MAKETSEKSAIETKDYWTIIALEAMGHVAEHIEPAKTQDGRSTILVYHFNKEALPDYEKWMRGVNDEPFGTVRKIQQSANNFKNNLHRFCT